MTAANRERGVTVLELLMVVGVIVVLAGMIFAVAAAARDHARSAVCITNRRHVMIASVQYATDFKLTEGGHVDPMKLVEEEYLPTLNACPCDGWYSLEALNVMPKCTEHGSAR
jgi:hypothetical protein